MIITSRHVNQWQQRQRSATNQPTINPKHTKMQCECFPHAESNLRSNSGHSRSNMLRNAATKISQHWEYDNRANIFAHICLLAVHAFIILFYWAGAILELWSEIMHTMKTSYTKTNSLGLMFTLVLWKAHSLRVIICKWNLSFVRFVRLQNEQSIKQTQTHCHCMHCILYYTILYSIYLTASLPANEFPHKRHGLPACSTHIVIQQLEVLPFDMLKRRA